MLPCKEKGRREERWSASSPGYALPPMVRCWLCTATAELWSTTVWPGDILGKGWWRKLAIQGGDRGVTRKAPVLVHV